MKKGYSTHLNNSEHVLLLHPAIFRREALGVQNLKIKQKLANF